MKKRIQKGFTLVEVLAVVIIIGILATIAVPLIGTIVENNRKDAYIATAQNISSSARLAKVSNSYIFSDNDVSLNELITEGYIEGNLVDPWGGTIDPNSTVVTIDPQTNEYSITIVSDSGRNIPNTNVSTLSREDIVVP